MSPDTHFHKLAFELLGIDGLPLPRVNGYEGDPYLTDSDYGRLCMIVCRRASGVTARDWWEASVGQRIAYMEAAQAAAGPAADAAIPNRAPTPEAPLRPKEVSAFPPHAPAVASRCGLLHFDLPTIFKCAVELAEAVASILPSEWENPPLNIAGPASPHSERWREWGKRLDRIEEESARLKRVLGATRPFTASDLLASLRNTQDTTLSSHWESFGRSFSDSAHDRIVRLALIKLATAAIDLSGFATWQERQWNMRERGLCLLTWGLAQLWDGLSGEERSSVQDRLRRTHKAIGWPCDPVAEPPSYDGPEEIPLEYQYRTVSPEMGFIACPPGYLDGIQQASNAQIQQRQDKFLHRATLAQFVELAERTSQAIRALAKRDFDTPGEWGDLYNNAFDPLICLLRAKEVRSVADWPDDALEQRNLLADTAGPLLAAIGGWPDAKETLKPEDADKAFEDFTRATNHLRDIAHPQTIQAAVQPATAVSAFVPQKGQSQTEPTGGVDVPAEKPILKLPPDAAVKAYRLKWILGVPRQAEIADRLSRELRKPVSQGQVSKWLRQAEEFVRAGGVLPGLPDTPSEKPLPVDPERLDLGPRQDGRTERQRGRRSDDD